MTNEKCHCCNSENCKICYVDETNTVITCNQCSKARTIVDFFQTGDAVGIACSSCLHIVEVEIHSYSSDDMIIRCDHCLESFEYKFRNKSAVYNYIKQLPVGESYFLGQDHQIRDLTNYIEILKGKVSTSKDQSKTIDEFKEGLKSCKFYFQDVFELIDSIKREQENGFDITSNLSELYDVVTNLECAVLGEDAPLRGENNEIRNYENEDELERDDDGYRHQIDPDRKWHKSNYQSYSDDEEYGFYEGYSPDPDRFNKVEFVLQTCDEVDKLGLNIRIYG